jgi:hypothetical protein
VKNISADVVGVAAGSTCFAKGPTMTCRTLGFQNNGGSIPPPWTTTFPANVAQIRGTQQVVVGYHGAYLVRLTTGAVYGVGEGRPGIFGVANPPSLGPFVAMGGVSDAVDVAMGVSHACVVRANGDVLCAGAGYNGEVLSGVDSQATYTSPATNAVGATQIALAPSRTCALRGNGTVACWGSPWAPLYPAPTPVTDVSFPLPQLRTSIAHGGYTLAALRTGGAADTYFDGASGPALANAAPGGKLRPGLRIGQLPIWQDICSLEPTGKIACFGGGDPAGFLPGFD